MSIYHTIYHNLCSRNVNKKCLWEQKENGLHRHHIIPKHSGGLDSEDNFTYLTVREHIIAHYLLWKINGNINDLRSMKMLGAELSVNHRRLIGIWCKENEIGFWNQKHEEKRREWRTSGAISQIEKKIGIYDPVNFEKHASLGGKASVASGNNKEWMYWMSPEGQRERASMGGKAHKGKKAMYKPGDSTFKRVESKDWDSYLQQGYIFGSPYTGERANRKKAKLISP